jgi:hypothetical protein
MIKPRRMRWAGYVTQMGRKEMRIGYWWESQKEREGKLEGKRPLERPRRRWVNNIKFDFREMGWGGMDWI